MTIRPIIFSAPMVRALLEGRKTQTRRIVNGVPPSPGMDNVYPGNTPRHPAPYLDAYCSRERTPENPRGMSENWCYWTRDDRCGPQFKVPYVPGDLLWVKEAFALPLQWDDFPPGLSRGPVRWRADDLRDLSDQGKWRPGMFMPRWASRLTLTVTDVRVQRLQEIDEQDAFSEGVYALPNGSLTHDGVIGSDSGVDAFARLWRMIHGPGAWDQNPRVVAVTFDVHKVNVDQFSQAGKITEAAQ